MAIKPSDIAAKQPPPPPASAPTKPLAADEVKAKADAYEVVFDDYLEANASGTRHLLPYPAYHPEVLAELVRRYVAAGWPGARPQSDVRLLLDTRPPPAPPPPRPAVVPMAVPAKPVPAK